MADIVIRNSNSGDVERIVEIAIDQWTVIYGEYKSLIGQDLFDVAFKDALHAKAETIRASAFDHDRCLVAVCDGTVCGFCFFKVEENRVGILSNNAVDSDHRGRGIAKMLYDRAFDLMRSYGAEVVKVQTGLDDAHAAARRAYEKSGFTVGLPSVTYYKKL